MDVSEALKQIKEIKKDYEGDKEELHWRLDKLLTEILDSLGYGEVTDIFWDIDKWYA